VVEEICTHVAIIDKSHIAEEGTVEEVFRNPQTEIARKMILPERDDVQTDMAEQAYRLVFDEHSSSEAVIAKMVVETKCLVNILHAELQNIEGVSYGQMVVQFGDDNRGRDKAIAYLKANQILVEEVK
jgi:D-methionine transport system ATP-binding protein